MEVAWHRDPATMRFYTESDRELMEIFHRQAEDGRQVLIRVIVKWSEAQRIFPLLFTCPDIFSS